MPENGSGVGAFRIEGVDLETGTVLVEIHKSVLGAAAKSLLRTRANERNKVYRACWALGEQFRNAAAVLYEQCSAEDFGFAILEPVEDDDDKLV